MNPIRLIYDGEGLRLDAWLAGKLDMSRSAVAQLLEQDCVLADGGPVTKKYKCRPGEALLVSIPPARPPELLPQEIPLTVLYEDDDLLVVDKPKGMVVHPAPGNPDGTLVNALLAHCGGSLSGINGVLRPGIVHRIDKDTSGLLVVAKHDAAHAGLAEQISAHSFERFYEAVVYGNFREDSGRVDAPIGRHPADRKRMAVTQRNSKPAVTHYSVLQRFVGFTHLRLQLETGRTHQIRVHMAYIGHPVAGDPVYGPSKVISSLGGQCLHARAIGFDHPITGVHLYFESPLPAYFTRFLSGLTPQ